MATALTSLALRPRRREVKPPLVRAKTIIQREEGGQIELEANLDPLEILKAAGVGILVGGVALTAGWLLWDGLAAPTPFGSVQVFRGVKESPFWREQAEIYGVKTKEQLELRRQCADLKEGYRKLLEGGADETAVEFKAKAAELGCRWAR